MRKKMEGVKKKFVMLESNVENDTIPDCVTVDINCQCI